MKWFLCGALLLLGGGLIGFKISESRSSEEIVVEVIRKPNESEIRAFLETQETDDLQEWDEMAQVALEGDVESSWKMYSYYTYAQRDYERSYFWAVFCERQGWDTEKRGRLVESAEGNIEAKYWSRTRDPDRGKIRSSEDWFLPGLE